MLVRLLLVTCLVVVAGCLKARIWTDVAKTLLPAGGAAELVQKHTSDLCTTIVMMDRTSPPSAIFQDFRSVWKHWQALAIFKANLKNIDTNSTNHLSRVISLARQVRQISRCTMVVVVSRDPDFLVAFAEWSLKSRLLVWTTKLVVLTHVALPQLQILLRTYWTFSMMNAVFLNTEDDAENIRYGVYTYLPYSSTGSQVVKVAFWTSADGFKPLSSVSFFEEKFDNFHGATVNVTALPYMPFWDEEERRTLDGSRTTQYRGCDYRLLEAIASALNFTVRVLPTSSWTEVTSLIEKRISFISPVIFGMIIVRTKRYDFTFSYAYGHRAFVMAKPKLEPRWKSLYYPLTNEVWMALTVPLLLVPFVLKLFLRADQDVHGIYVSVEMIFQDMVGMLLGQNLSRRLSGTSSSKVLIAAWLVFALILAVAYRGNLTAALTLPKYPSRPETLQEIIAAVDMVTVPAYGEQYRKFYRESASPLFQALARLMKPGPSLMEGFRRALVKKSAHIEGPKTLRYEILDKFTEEDGSTQLYVGREPLLSMPCGWPIPHDAPYKAHIDRCMLAVVEAGLYEKWTADVLTQTKLKSQRRQRQRQAAGQQERAKETKDVNEEGLPILTLSHTQGGFILLIVGLALAILSFARELLSWP